MRIQDSLLRELITEKGIVDAEGMVPVRKSMYLWQGDITTLRIDAIVNAANSGMLGCFVPDHACIDNAIHTYAGIQLRQECAAIIEKQGYPEPAGRAKLTSAYNLPSKQILHTVGPIVEARVTDEHKHLLASCYRSCLELAAQSGLGSVAFCCISTGVFRFPLELAARIAVKTVECFIQEHPLKVVFNVFTDRDAEIYSRLLRG